MMMVVVILVVQVVQHIQMHLATLVPALLIGVIGGLLAAIFTRLNTFICQRRTLLLAKIPNRLLQRLVRVLETILLVVSMTTVYICQSPYGYCLLRVTV